MLPGRHWRRTGTIELEQRERGLSSDSLSDLENDSGWGG